MKLQRLLNGLTNISTVFMLVFLYLFISRNSPGLTQLYAVIGIALVYAVIYLAATARFLSTLANNNEASKDGCLSRSLLLISSVLLVYAFLDAAVIDYSQPLSLYDEAIGTLALWWLFLIVQNMVAIFTPAAISRAAVGMAIVAVLSWPLAASLWWINVPKPGVQVAANTPVYTGGEDGYKIYRMPGPALIPAGATLANGDELELDRLCFASIRKKGAAVSAVIRLPCSIWPPAGCLSPTTSAAWKRGRVTTQAIL